VCGSPGQRKASIHTQSNSEVFIFKGKGSLRRYQKKIKRGESETTRIYTQTPSEGAEGKKSDCKFREKEKRLTRTEKKKGEKKREGMDGGKIGELGGSNWKILWWRKNNIS